MTDGIDITLEDFKRYSTKEQNVVIFQNLLAVKKVLGSYKFHQKIQYVLGSLISSALLWLLYVHTIAYP